MASKKPDLFVKDVSGKSFKTTAGVMFKVMSAEYFPQESIAQQHNRYLSFLRAGLLVSVSFHGYPVPLITVERGVFRLIGIKIGGEIIIGSLPISTALGITKTRQPDILRQA